MDNIQQGSFVRNYDGAASREHVVFRMDAVQDQAASLEAGRAIFKEVEFVEIHFPGNNLTVINKRVTDEHRQRWPQHYAAFKNGGHAPVEGTPLSAWTALTKAQVKEFESLNIYSVEQLASVNDGILHQLGMGGRTWRDRAKAFIDAASENAVTDRLASENVVLREQNEALQNQVRELGAAVAGIQKAMSPQAAPVAVQSFAPQAAEPSSLDNTDGYVEPRRGPGRPRRDAA